VPRLCVRRRRSQQSGADEFRSLFVVSLPRSLSSLLYVAAATSVGLTEPMWTSDGELLNRDRVPRRLQGHAPVDERFTLLSSSPGVFTAVTAYLDDHTERRGHAYKDVVQPFVVGGWDGLSDFRVLKVRRSVAEVAYAMLKRRWWYPARAARVYEVRPWTLVEGLVRADAVIEALPGESLSYADAVVDPYPLDAALRRLYPEVSFPEARYIDRRFVRTRKRLEADRRDSPLYRCVESMVSAVRERLAYEEPVEAPVEAVL
jgi:hypothetical protein